MTTTTQALSSRRSLLQTGFSACAAVALASTPAVPASSLLAELTRRLSEAHKLLDAASDQENDTYDAYLKMAPARPAAMKWRAFDPVSGYPERDGSTRSYWCKAQEIDAMRGKPVTRPEFIGTDEQSTDNMTLWAEVPDPNGQRRVDELIAALDVFRAQQAEAKIRSGFAAAEARANAAYLEYEELLRQIIAAPASSVEELRLKASVVVSLWENVEDAPTEDDNADRHLVWSIIHTLAGVQVQ